MKVPEPPPPPRRYTSPSGRIVIPVLLLVLLIVILGRPILISGLNLDQEEDPTPVPTQSDDRNGGERSGPMKLAGTYPKVCLRSASAPGAGLVAASDGGTVTVRTPTGGAGFALRANPPIGWSPSGTFLATAGADLWTSQGNPIGVAFSGPVDVWAWSPVADCMVGIDGNRLVVVQPRERAEFLLRNMTIDTFAFAPDGSSLVFAVDEGRDSGLWLADLRSGKVEQLRSSIGWTLVGWPRADRPLLERARKNGADALGFTPGDEVARCGNDIAAIVNGRLATLGPSGSPRFIAADRSFDYRTVACSPNGDLLVTVRGSDSGADTTMAVLRRNGSMVEEVAQGSIVEDHPMWGPSGTGVVFVATVGGEGAAGPLVWFLPEGGSAQTTGLRIGDIDSNLDARLDWSATPPLGHPTR